MGTREMFCEEILGLMQFTKWPWREVMSMPISWRRRLINKLLSKKAMPIEDAVEKIESMGVDLSR